jgi:hypothetical protein
VARRGHTNIRKRLLIHSAGFNLGLLMRQLIGVGTPRGLQGRVLAVVTILFALIRSVWDAAQGHRRPGEHVSSIERRLLTNFAIVLAGPRELAFTTAC